EEGKPKIQHEHGWRRLSWHLIVLDLGRHCFCARACAIKDYKGGNVVCTSSTDRLCKILARGSIQRRISFNSSVVDRKRRSCCM
ncbi:hypothetical protein JMJ77_0002351, partial [Colletotrichum scovillei]